MSVQAMTWVLEHSTSTGTTRCVLMAIANHVNPDGTGWVYRDRILAEANCSLDSYKRAITWAQEAGELSRDVKQGAAMKAFVGYRPNEFTFVALADPVGSNLPPSAGSNLPPSEGGNLPPSQEEPSKEPSKEPSIPCSPQGPASPTVLDGFAEWWTEYPRKVGKPKAISAYKTAVARKHVDPADLLAGLRRWAAYWRAKNEPEFIPHPTTWLNQERYNDEPPPLPKARGQAAVDETLQAYRDRGLTPGDLFAQNPFEADDDA